MMRLRNIPRADEVLENSPLVIKEETAKKGCWDSVFLNGHPIRLEIGMGKGQFLLTLAKQNPGINFIGIERYSSVLLRALEKHNTEAFQEVDNIRFLCMDARALPDVFERGEIDKIYLNFSDPWPKARHAKRRLTSAEFFARYDEVLKEGGTVEFKTDNRVLFDFSVEQLAGSDTWQMAACTYDLHHEEEMNEGNVMTEYEEKFSGLGQPICKLVAERK